MQTNLLRYAHKSYNVGYKENGQLGILDQSLDHEDQEEFQDVVMSNLTSILKSKNKFKALTKGFKEAKAFIIYGNSDIKNESSSSEDELDAGGKNVNVFFDDSEQGKEKTLKKAIATLFKSVMKMKQDEAEAEAEAQRQKELEEKLIQGEESQNSEEEPMLDDVQGASHSESETDPNKPTPPEITVLPPFNYKAVKTIHYAKFFTSCIFTAEQQLEMTTKGRMLTRERASTQMDTSDLDLPYLMKFFTFYYFFRMCLLDICYLTLGEMPTLQILLPLTLEGIFIAIVIVTARLSKIFGSKFVVFRLLLQGTSIFLWLLMSYFGTRKSEKYDYRGIRYQEYMAALPDYLSIFMEWLTVFMIMLMLGVEVYWSLKKIYLAVKNSFRNQVAKIKRKKARK